MGYASLTGSIGVLRRLVVISYNTSLTSALASAPVKMGTAVTSRRVSQSPFSFTIQTRGVEDQRRIVDFIRAHHVNAVTKDGSELRFTYPTQGLDYLGFIRRVSYKNSVGEHAPTITLEMLLVRDLVNTKTSSSSIGGDFNDFYSTDMEFNSEDSVFAPPISGVNDGLGGAVGAIDNSLDNLSGSAPTSNAPPTRGGPSGGGW